MTAIEIYFIYGLIIGFFFGVFAERITDLFLNSKESKENDLYSSYIHIGEKPKQEKPNIKPPAQTIPKVPVKKLMQLNEGVKKPKKPTGKLIKEGNTRKKCNKCGSSLKRKWIFFTVGCIQPKCNNYYKEN